VLLAVAVGGAGLALAGSAQAGTLSPQAAPANDNFASATPLSGGSGTLTGTNVGATKQSGEPDHAGGGGTHSV
jgi:hypothetical protein